jgi:hypothetical protein
MKKSSTKTAPNGRIPPISTDTAGCMYHAWHRIASHRTAWH